MYTFRLMVGVQAVGLCRTADVVDVYMATKYSASATVSHFSKPDLKKGSQRARVQALVGSTVNPFLASLLTVSTGRLDAAAAPAQQSKNIAALLTPPSIVISTATKSPSQRNQISYPTIRSLTRVPGQSSKNRISNKRFRGQQSTLAQSTCRRKKLNRDSLRG